MNDNRDCRDCVWAKVPNWFRGMKRCTHPETPQLGNQPIPIELARTENRPCGPGGKLWEPKDERD